MIDEKFVYDYLCTIMKKKQLVLSEIPNEKKCLECDGCGKIGFVDEDVPRLEAQIELLRRLIEKFKPQDFVEC